MKANLKQLGILSITICALTLTVGLGAQAQQGSNQKHHHYKLIDIGTFGGPQSHVNPGSGQDFGNFASILNNRGIVTGWADTSMPDPFPGFCFSEECFVVHTFEWKNGVKNDLGVLPGGASSASNWVTENGLVASSAQEQKAEHHRYKPIDMGTFGGPASSINFPFSQGTLTQP